MVRRSGVMTLSTWTWGSHRKRWLLSARWAVWLSGCSEGAAGEVCGVKGDRVGPGDPAFGSRGERGVSDVGTLPQGAHDDLRGLVEFDSPVDGDPGFCVQGWLDGPVDRDRENNHFRIVI